MPVDKYIDELKNWFAKFKRYTVTYKQGFFHLSNLANSPYTIVESFDKMPFCKHVRDKKLLTSDTLFLKAQLYYSNPEEGLWVFVSDLFYKKNLMMSNIYDKNLPVDYHFLNLHYKKQSFSSKSMIVNGTVLTDKTWTVFKAGVAESDYHFKDSNEQNITIYFTTAWLNKRFSNSKLHSFFKSDDNYILSNDNHEASDVFYSKFYDSVTGANASDYNNVLKQVQCFFEYFEQKLEREQLTENHFKLSDKDRKNIQRAEKQLMDGVLKEFPGIEKMAAQIGVSPTKLKADFKAIHNKSLYGYYSYHQMKMAYQLLAGKGITVKEVAKLLGYDNASKFTARFKEQFDMVPSEITKGV